MAAILNIETATPLCSVALALDGHVVAQRETQEEKSHAARLTIFIEEVLKEKNLHIRDLDAISIGKGPGSYTGLRIGVSTAKGLCYGANLPLIAVGTLKILFYQAAGNILIREEDTEAFKNALFCPMIDARRMEVFTCLYTFTGEVSEAVSAKIISQDSFSHLLSSRRMLFFGSGMDKCREVLIHPNAFFLEDVFPHAAAMAKLTEELFQRKKFENLAYFEPFYLKDFIATIPKKNLSVPDFS
jgi:tRNA threonylcarbamoyladenosine biosynthesis protein TsaB